MWVPQPPSRGAFWAQVSQNDRFADQFVMGPCVEAPELPAWDMRNIEELSGSARHWSTIVESHAKKHNMKKDKPCVAQPKRWRSAMANVAPAVTATQCWFGPLRLASNKKGKRLVSSSGSTRWMRCRCDPPSSAMRELRPLALATPCS